MSLTRLDTMKRIAKAKSFSPSENGAHGHSHCKRHGGDEMGKQTSCR